MNAYIGRHAELSKQVPHQTFAHYSKVTYFTRRAHDDTIPAMRNQVAVDEIV